MNKKKRILVVDDNSDFLNLVRRRLESTGYQVVTAQDGKEALRAMENSRPDAVLLDIMMPRMSGLELLKKIRKSDKKLPIFMLTGLTQEEPFRLARRFKASGFITKTKDLKQEIRNITAALGLSPKYRP